MTASKVAIVGLMALSLAACEGRGPKETIGTVVGAVGGAAVGSTIGSGSGKVVAVALGTLLGAYAGNEIGKSLDRADRMAMERTSQSALERNPTGQASTWHNPDSGHSGTVTPTRTVPVSDAAGPCREFEQTVTIDGKTETVYGTACRDQDGVWRMRNA